jgi:hypothetical protein
MLRRIPWPSWMTRLRYRVGRRGFFLLTLAWVDFVYGLRLWDPADPNEERRRYMAEAIPIADVQTSMKVWAVLWWATGVACLLNAFRKNDVGGFAAAAAIKVGWTVATVIAALQGMTEGWRTASVWFVVMVAVLVIGSWREEPPTFAEIADRIDAEEAEEAAQEGDPDA